MKYQWLRNGVAISGRHCLDVQAHRLRPRQGDPGPGHGVRLVLAGRQPGSQVERRDRRGSLAGYLTAVTPTIGGTRRVGYLLTAYRGTWKPSGITYSYQWLRNGVPISGATGKTYRLRSVDRGDRIRVRVTGRKAGYYTKTATSAATSTIR